MSSTIFQSSDRTIRHWYIPLIIGILLVILGIDVLVTPIKSYLSLAVFFSLMFLITGIMEIIFSVSNRANLPSWGWYLASGIASTLFGILLLSRPQISILTLPYVVGFFILFHSIYAIGWAYDLKRLGRLNWGNVLLTGVLGVIFSFILLWNPYFAGLTLVIWTGIAFIMIGVATIMLSNHLRRIKKAIKKDLNA
jgi:uncharacterized membrane protein HdeD (DUF308 family)